MGNYRFKLSDMIPNTWFYKLKDMRRPRNTHLSDERTPSKSKQHDLSPRKSYYFSRELAPFDGFYVSPEPPPRKSCKKRYHSRRRNFRSSSSPQPPSTVITSSVSTGCSCRKTVWSKADSPPDYSASSSSLSSSDDSSPLESSDADVKKINEMPGIELPPIVTKPAKFNDMIKDIKKKHNTGPVKKFSVNSSGVRLRTHSPRIGNRRFNQGHGRKSMSSTSSGSSSKRSTLSESLAVVKSSFDPQRDFRESMVEMILENNIRTSKELEDLLACYLSLNSDEYHELIIMVFKQIWFDLNDVRFK
ncbi:Transcription repressor OFP2 [Hibiscus syriacus]|uniref:Transcription repressor n=1 Tax=Hibiscus syriacus TaxID=106335 RepID=A0A6A3D3W1_HIBSY|nr:transcription repressor OFP1-like [Hibiscus syriacus]KAE8734052.1 Transcription repressor OFP2 [Hibiscus syriacus]